MDSPEPSPSRAILLKVMAVITAVLLLTTVKAVQGVPLGELLFFRSVLSIIPIWLWLSWRGEKLGPAFRTRRPLGHLVRGTLGMLVMGLSFYAVRKLPLPEAITLQYSQPLFVVALSALILGESVRLFRWGAVAFGFLGVLVITWPNLSLLAEGGGAMSMEQISGALAALLGAALYACVLLVVGQLVKTERSTTVVLWLWMMTSVLTALTAPFGWVVPTPTQLLMLTFCGFLGGISHMLTAESLRYAPASTTASFEYTSLIFALILGYVIFGDTVGPNALIGGAMVVAAGLVILWRERRVGGRAAAAAAPKE